jgi:hypothetical protein
MLPGELVMVEIELARLVSTADVEDKDVWIVQLVLGGISALDSDVSRAVAQGQANGQELIPMCLTGMSDNCYDVLEFHSALVAPPVSPDRFARLVRR